MEFGKPRIVIRCVTRTFLYRSLVGVLFLSFLYFLLFFLLPFFC